MLYYSNSNRSIGFGVQPESNEKKENTQRKTNVKCIKILCRMKAKMFIIKLFCTHIPATNVERSVFFISLFMLQANNRNAPLCVFSSHCPFIENVHTSYRRNAFPVVTSKSQVNYSTFFLAITLFFFFGGSVRIVAIQKSSQRTTKSAHSRIVSSIILECCL